MPLKRIGEEWRGGEGRGGKGREGTGGEDREGEREGKGRERKRRLASIHSLVSSFLLLRRENKAFSVQSRWHFLGFRLLLSPWKSIIKGSGGKGYSPLVW